METIDETAITNHAPLPNQGIAEHESFTTSTDDCRKDTIQWSARAQRGDANSGWPNGDLVGKFEYADARPCGSRESSWRIVLLRSKLRGEPNKFNLAEVIRPGYGQGIYATRSNLPPAIFRGRTEPQINTFITINFSCF